MTLSKTLEYVPGFFAQGEPANPQDVGGYAPHMGLLPGKTWEHVDAYIEGQQKTRGVRVKLILLLRHGEGLHNADKEKYGVQTWEAGQELQEKYIDAPVTAKGIEQSQAAGRMLQEEISRGLKIDRVVISPLDRTLHTYAEAFANSRDIPNTVVELARETLGVVPCDRRKPLAGKRIDFPFADFSEVQDEEDTWWQSDHRETEGEIEDRAQKLLDYLMHSRSESRICVVAHSGISRACFRVVGHRYYRPWNGEFVPLLVQEATA
ncbi:TPA: hypothetical protein N0F65_000538 [Lagenidium giganteum]|uniref:Phosphoglycerate mutase n=1 Tax=Lagenidium giganteum TaxID=4803 RepID=A0AAV2Z089_9STRA|nr:TPA: hypothetical protein N0F65_000538 [Lagenidium giganteum]